MSSLILNWFSYRWISVCEQSNTDFTFHSIIKAAILTVTFICVSWTFFCVFFFIVFFSKAHRDDPGAFYYAVVVRAPSAFVSSAAVVWLFGLQSMPTSWWISRMCHQGAVCLIGAENWPFIKLQWANGLFAFWCKYHESGMKYLKNVWLCTKLGGLSVWTRTSAFEVNAPGLELIKGEIHVVGLSF